MDTMKSGLDGEPRSALAAFISRLETDCYPWYEKASRRAYYAWLVTWWIAVLAGFITTVIGILVENEILQGPGVQAVLLILPSLGSLAAVLLTRFIENKALRERGRVAIQRMIAEARSSYASLGNEAPAITAFHNELIKRITSLEEEQLKGFLRSAQQQVG